MRKIYEVAVIGGGVIGSFIFDDLSRCNKSCVLIEKELDVATGMSKANSGLIHAGFDAKPNTLKAVFNVRGNQLYPKICSRLGIKLRKTGAYVVGDDMDAVLLLEKRGIENRVHGIKVLTKEEIKKEIPNINDKITCGLFAPSACIIDPYLLTICLAEEGVLNGGSVELDFNIVSIKKEKNYFKICSGNKNIYAKRIINCTGANFNEVSKLIGAEQYNFSFRRGEYYVLDKSEGDIVPTTIFPLPSKNSKGVLVTPTVDGNILVGPTSYDSEYNTKTTQEGLKEIKEKVSLMIKKIDFSKTIRVFSGVRVIAGEDFIIENSRVVENVVNVAGICSPGLSAAPAISEYVITKLLGFGMKIRKDVRKIKPYTKLKDLSLQKQNLLIKQNSAYGKIICKCEEISLGEIKDAINRPIRPTTIDGVKRRIRAGMGRCQGGFCSDKIASILAKENGVKMEDIVKEHKGGFYILNKGGNHDAI